MILLYRTLFAKWREWTSPHYRELQRQRRIMATATEFERWSVACAKAEKLAGGDSASGMLRWKRETKLYDRKLLQVRPGLSWGLARELHRDGDRGMCQHGSREDAYGREGRESHPMKKLACGKRRTNEAAWKVKDDFQRRDQVAEGDHVHCMQGQLG